MEKSNKRQLRLTLDSLSYKCLIAKDSEADIEVVLPYGSINERVQLFQANKKNKEKKDVVLKPVDTINIRVFFVNTTEKVVNVALSCDNKMSKITGDVKLQPKLQQIYKFTSIDGGLHWLVNCISRCSCDGSGGSSGGGGETTDGSNITVNGKQGPTIIINSEDIGLKQSIPNITATNVQGAINALASKIVKNEQDISTNKDNIASMETRLETAETKIVSLESRMGVVESQIANLSGSTVDVMGVIAANTDKISIVAPML